MTLDINWPTMEELRPQEPGLSVSHEAAGNFLLESMRLFNASYGRIALAANSSDVTPQIICAVDRCLIDSSPDYNPTENLAMMNGSTMMISGADAQAFFSNHVDCSEACQLLVAPVMEEDIRFGVITLGSPVIDHFSLNDRKSLQDICRRFAQMISLTSIERPPVTPMHFMRSHPFFTNVPWPMLIIDHLGVIQELNQSAETLFGCMSAEMSGRPLADALMKATDGPHGETTFIFRADGVRVPVELTESPLSFIGRGRDVSLIVLRDLSQEWQLLEQHLKTAELAGIFNTIATVNHEINNPLFGMIATVQLLKNEMKDSTPSVHKKLDRIAECCERIQLITENLSRVIRPARRTYAANEGMLDLTRATSSTKMATPAGDS